MALYIAMEGLKQVPRCGNDLSDHLGDISAHWSQWSEARVMGDWTGAYSSIRRTGEANLRMKEASRKLRGAYFLHSPSAADGSRAHVGLALKEGWDD